MVVSTAINGLISISQELGIFAIGATIVGWVMRDLIRHYFDKELGKYQTEVDKELNRYQNELEKEKLQFSELHEERANITAELYERFITFERDMRNLTDPVEVSDSPSKDERLQTAAKSGNDFIEFYLKKKIYFPTKICETVEELNSELNSIFNKFSIYRPYKSTSGSPHDVEQWHDSWEKVTEDEVPALKKELEEHFRELLGVEMQDEN